MGFRFFEISQEIYQIGCFFLRNIEINDENGIDQKPGNYFSLFLYCYLLNSVALRFSTR